MVTKLLKVEGRFLICLQLVKCSSAEQKNRKRFVVDIRKAIFFTFHVGCFDQNKVDMITSFLYPISANNSGCFVSEKVLADSSV